MLQYNYTQIIYSKIDEDGMDNECSRNEKTKVGIGEGLLEVIFEQVSRMLSLPGRKVGEQHSKTDGMG